MEIKLFDNLETHLYIAESITLRRYNMNLKYEKIDKNNIDIAYDIQKNIWPEDPDYNDFLDKIENSSDDNISWLVYDNREIIGITGVYIEDEDNESIWLDWFAILPQYRRRGYGKKVLLDTIDYCKKLNKYLYFRVDTTYYENRPALFLYDEVMDLREDYTTEDTDDKKYEYLIYTYALQGKAKPWNNRYLGLNEYYEKCV